MFLRVDVYAAGAEQKARATGLFEYAEKAVSDRGREGEERGALRGETRSRSCVMRSICVPRRRNLLEGLPS